MSDYFPETNSSRTNIKFELDLSDYATKTHLEYATDVDTSDFVEKTD